MQTLEASKTIQTPPVVKDPGIRLVPAGGGGWGRKKEDRNKSGGRWGSVNRQPSHMWSFFIPMV